ncbi:U3 small nucleolar ribonucleoprotein protein IMP4 [Parasteatoda tepidariorum]|uniref:U3 small nucleolar ribonucleoprotein IMP4 n=1 Tax=Parasteatoda tepidariorum TaxID=114398 RepID=A0A2L2Y9T8_PARTP|nr:U3 small nucleolar ribonucleoprotein protein IMP4 [Parasteatoda tepidariorum]
MFQRQAKERRQLIYGAKQSKKDQSKIEKKTLVKKSLEENKVLPTTLQKEALRLQDSLEWDDIEATTEEDDEYRWALVEDPKIVITTSRDPSIKLKLFAKELKLIFPNSQKMNRGNYSFKTLIEACKTNGVTDFIMVTETRGVPDGFIVSHLPHGPTARFGVLNAVLRHDIKNIGPMPQEYPHLIFQNFRTKLGKRVESILKHLFPVPKEEAKRVISFLNNSDWIMFRHHVHHYNDKRDIQLTELGPRFLLRLFEIKRGTLDEFGISDVEWALTQFARTAVKNQFLSKEPLFPE